MDINFQHVNFKYDKKQKINTLNDINLTISKENEFITILGHTGSGKSTLVQLMNALILPTSGSLTIFNQEIKQKRNQPLKEIRKRIGLVFQFPEYQLFEETVLKDIMFGPVNFGLNMEQAKQQALDTAKLIGISDDLLERAPFNLSGGQKRKVAIAGILASNPDILIFDEPTVGLDPKGKKELLSLLDKIHKETHKTIIIITHDMNIVANYSNRSIVLKEGNIVFDGKPIDLFNNKTMLQSMNLDLPYISRVAENLKAAGKINYKSVPLTLDELYDCITGDLNE
ncbi:MAG: energy-coupling factor transporter ATPase [Bacilli bacterium]|nr:energy-coupling factor transporter ATPase [Bacilli bacterium]